MPFFQPESTIVFANTGLDDINKTVHTSNQAVASWVISHALGSQITNASFQRLDQGWEIRVPTDEISYELLMMADTVAINNSITYGGLWTFGIIDKIDWRNPGCVYVYFHIDWYTTTLGTVQYENTWAYIEREHVVNDWNGSNPEFSNMGVDEGFNTIPDTPIHTDNHPFSFLQKKVMVYTPYNDECKPNFEGTMENGIYTALYRHTMTISECNEYLKAIAESDTADLAMIPSIVSIPDEFSSVGGHKQFVHQMPWLNHIPSVPNLNNAKCWSGEFCQIKLTTGTGDSVSVNPQWFGSNKSNFTIDVNFFFNGGDGGCTASLINENTTYTKETYGDFSVSIMGLPQAVWVGDSYAQWKAANLTGYTISQLAGAIGTIYSSIHAGSRPLSKNYTPVNADWDAQGSVVNGAVSLAQQAGSIMQTIGNARTSGTVLGGSNNADINTAAALGKYGLQVIFYMCQSYIMKSVDSFFDRFGYKVNRLKQLNRMARPKWTYIKCHEVHLNAGGNINHNARMYIQNMLCNGVTFWRDPDAIGDYSNPEGNKG